jgi:recombination protein RecT
MTATTVTQAVAQRDNSPSALIDRYQADFATVLPTHIKSDQWIRLTRGILRRDEKLAAVAKRNPGSFLAAVLDCARLGLEPGVTYHLVPFGGEIVGIVDYTGEIELIYRAGAVSSVKAEIVHANDTFEFDPSMPRPHHVIDWFGGDRGAMIGVYAYAEMKDGGTSRVVVMNRAAVEKVKAVSKTAKKPDSPWQQWEDRMWLKTAVHQLANWVPTSAEYIREQARAVAQAGVTNGMSRDELSRDAQAWPAPAVDYVDGEVVDEAENRAEEPS